jgi:hypothetical protein
MEDPRHRRRWAASYALSLLIHGLALVLLVLASVELIGSSTQVAVPTDVTVFARK